MNCAYIPRVNTTTCEMDIKWQMHAFEIGSVKRVDFSPIGKTSGFKLPEKTLPYKMAFVHFEKFYDSANAQLFISTLTKGGSFKMQFENHYWMVLPAKNTVPETTMNIHQVVENCRFLEKKIEEQSALIEKQTDLIEKLLSSALSEKSEYPWEEYNWKEYNWKDNDEYNWKDPTLTDGALLGSNRDDTLPQMAEDDTFQYPFYGKMSTDSNSDTSSDMPSLEEIEEGEYIEKSKTHSGQQFTEHFCGNN